MKELKQHFEGKSEVKGYIFRQLERTETGYIYEVTLPDVPKKHYEVFMRKENRRFGVISYPRSSSFGLWAWTYPTLIEAREKLAEITQAKNMPNLHRVTGVLAS